MAVGVQGRRFIGSDPTFHTRNNRILHNILNHKLFIKTVPMVVETTTADKQIDVG